MRTIILASLLSAAAAPAAAQYAYVLQHDVQVETELNAARQRDIVLQNELSNLDTRIRTDQALRDTDPHLGQGPIRILPPPKGAPAAAVGPFVSIPDSRLAASNARVRAAASDKR